MIHKPQKTVETWLRDNAWNLIVTGAMVFSTFTLLQYRVNAVEKKQAEYPSYDYFELKFKEIDKNLVELNATMRDHIKDSVVRK